MAAVATALALPLTLRAQAPSATKPRRIGALYPGSDPQPGVPDAQRASAPLWKNLGWTLGETLLIERRYAERRLERLPEMANELLRGGAELLTTFEPQPAVAAARATKTVPIVFVGAFLPIEAGLIDSYARPGRNATGIAVNAGFEVWLKQMEFLRAVAPSAQRLAVLGADLASWTVSGAPMDIGAPVVKAGKVLGFEVQAVVAPRVEDIDHALAQAAAGRAQALVDGGGADARAARRIAEFALRQRWPSSCLSPNLLDAGFLLYYGPTQAEFVEELLRALEMVDRILRGAKAGDIPVQLPSRYELAINLKTARALGLALPQALLLRAERVIE